MNSSLGFSICRSAKYLQKQARLYSDHQTATDQSHPYTRFTIACHTISVRLLETEPSLIASEANTLP
jgi:hypothetical protein